MDTTASDGSKWKLLMGDDDDDEEDGGDEGTEDDGGDGSDGGDANADTIGDSTPTVFHSADFERARRRET